MLDASGWRTAHDPARRFGLTATSAGLALVILAIAALDRPVANWAHTLHRPAWCVALTHIADVPGPAAVLCLAALGLAWLAGWQTGLWGRVALAVCLATLTAEASKDVLKFAFGRPWPETWIDNNPSWIGAHVYGFAPFHGGRGWASFPSGHTTAITAPCAALWPHLRGLRPLLALLPCLVAIGLIGADFHFLGDCIAGALLGAACAAAANAATDSARPRA